MPRLSIHCSTKKTITLIVLQFYRRSGPTKQLIPRILKGINAISYYIAESALGPSLLAAGLVTSARQVSRKLHRYNCNLSKHIKRPAVTWARCCIHDLVPPWPCVRIQSANSWRLFCKQKKRNGHGSALNSSHSIQKQVEKCNQETKTGKTIYTYSHIPKPRSSLQILVGIPCTTFALNLAGPCGMGDGL